MGYCNRVCRIAALKSHKILKMKQYLLKFASFYFTVFAMIMLIQNISAQHVQSTIEKTTFELNYTGYQKDKLDNNAAYFAAWTKNTGKFNVELITESGKQYLRAKDGDNTYELSYTTNGSQKLTYGRFYAVWSKSLGRNPVTTSTADVGNVIHTSINGKVYELSWTSLFIGGADDPYKRKAVVWTPNTNLFESRIILPGDERLNGDRPVNEYTYLGSHNAIASYSYGYITQNSQRYSVTTQLEGGVRALEIDIVHDAPDDSNPEGVYICHCGDAPHSYSKTEIQRAKDKDMKSKVPLPFWSHGATFARFSNVLKEIDDWLIEHPKEIVFVYLQKNNVTSEYLDAEITNTSLKTGVYVHTENPSPWPYRSDLINKNKRIIFLNTPSGSRYSTSQHNTIWKGKMAPNIHGKSEMSKFVYEPKDQYRFTAVANYLTTPTDAITARLFNERSEIDARIAEWKSKNQTAMPSIFFVNQAQIGDPVAAINEINGAAYQVENAFPTDAVGDWIVNASADAGLWIYDQLESLGSWSKGAYEDTAEGIEQWINGSSAPSTSKSIRLKNRGGYDAQLVVMCQVDKDINGTTMSMPETVYTRYIQLGISRSVVLPENLTKNSKIWVIINGRATFENDVYRTEISSDFTGEKCFKTWGTIFDTEGGPCD